MSYTYLITEKELKQKSILHGNVDSKLIGMAMQEAQDIHTREALGTALYNQIIAEFDDSNLTPENDTLLENYVKPMQKYYILKEFLMYGWIKLANSSIGTRDAEDLITSFDSGINRMEDKFMQKAEYYRKRLINFIEDNILDYPLYKSLNQEIEPSNKSYTSRFTFLNEAK